MFEGLKPSETICGVDIGQSNDFSVFTCLQVFKRLFVPDFGDAQDKGREYHVVYQERLRRVPYPQQVEWIKDRLTRMPRAEGLNSYCLIDLGGVGRTVFDYLKQDIPLPWNLAGILFTGGTEITKDRRCWNVPKSELVNSLIVAAESGRLRVAHDIITRPQLELEMKNYVRVRTRTGKETFENANPEIHDDCVSSLMMATFWAMRFQEARAFVFPTAYAAIEGGYVDSDVQDQCTSLLQ